MLIVSALELTNSEIHDNNKALSNHLHHSYFFRDREHPEISAAFSGLAHGSAGFVPLTLLVPHTSCQDHFYSISFLQISSLIRKLQTVSYFKRQETITDFHRQCLKERTQQVKLLRSTMLNSPLKKFESPQRALSPMKSSQSTDDQGFQMKGIFLCTTIQPTNVYKKFLTQVADKELDRFACNMLNSYHIVNKHNLFDCKSAITIKLLPQQQLLKTTRDQLLVLNFDHTMLTNFVANLKEIKDKPKPMKAYESLPEPQKTYF